MLRHPPKPPLFPYTTLFRSISAPLEWRVKKLADWSRMCRNRRSRRSRTTRCPTSVSESSAICATACSGTSSRSEEHTSELQSRLHLVCRLLLEKKKNRNATIPRFRSAKHTSYLHSECTLLFPVLLFNECTHTPPARFIYTSALPQHRAPSVLIS